MERKNIQFNAKLQAVEKINDEFLKCKAYVCALGKNRNLSYISQEAADEALYSLFNIPVIGHMYEDENGSLHMGGHDATVAIDENGKYVWKNLTVPFGVVPAQDNVHYEDVEEPNGDIKTYIVADCILWVGRYPELANAAYSDEWLFNQSMEINVNDYAPLGEDKNYTDILHYTYSALCLLGKSDNKDYDVTPCFPESHLEVAYELGANEKFMALMDELRKDLSEVFSAKDEGKEGEAKMTNEIRDAILAEFNISVDELDFEITEDMTEDNFRAKVSEYAEAKTNKDDDVAQDEKVAADDEATPEVVDEPEAEETDEDKKPGEEYAFTYREKAEILDKMMPNTANIRYWLCDFDDKYAYVERTTYDDDGNYTDERGRFEYAYDDVNKTATVVGEFEHMIQRWLTAEEDEAINAMRKEYEELVAYKAQRENNDKEHALDEVVEQFADLSGNDEFDSIVANKYSYESVEALQNACYIIRGKFGLMPKAHKPVEPSVPVMAPHETATLRERLHEEYSRR